MARIRSIKPDIRRSRTVCSWPYVVRWTFAGLPGYLDDEGRGLDDVRLLKAELYPLDDDMTARKLEQHLLAIATNGPLCRYEVDGEKYLHIVSWEEHQRVNRPTPSRIPPCPRHESSPEAHGSLTEDSVSPHPRKGREGNKEGNKEGRPAAAPAEPEPPRTDVERMCRYFLAGLEKNGVKATITEKWRTDARLMLDRDKRDPLDIRAVMDFALTDSFWRANVHGIPKLREQFDRLRLQAEQKQPAEKRYAPGFEWLENM